MMNDTLKGGARLQRAFSRGGWDEDRESQGRRKLGCE